MVWEEGKIRLRRIQLATREIWGWAASTASSKVHSLPLCVVPNLQVETRKWGRNLARENSKNAALYLWVKKRRFVQFLNVCSWLAGRFERKIAHKHEAQPYLELNINLSSYLKVIKCVVLRLKLQLRLISLFSVEMCSVMYDQTSIFNQKHHQQILKTWTFASKQMLDTHLDRFQFVWVNLLLPSEIVENWQVLDYCESCDSVWQIIWSRWPEFHRNVGCFHPFFSHVCCESCVRNVPIFLSIHPVMQ